MKNKYLALIMALIMCFSFTFASLAVVEGEQVTQQEIVQPTEEDIADKAGDVIDGIAGDEMSEAGEHIMDGFYEGQGILQMLRNVLETIKIALANFMNTVFKYFNIGTGDSLLH